MSSVTVDPAAALAGRPRTDRSPREPLPRGVTTAAGVAAGLLLWELLAHVWLSERQGLPTPYNTGKAFLTDGWSFYWPLVRQTGGRALPGYVVGNGVALALALVVLLVPATEKVVMQIAVATYCLPLLAVGPILTLTLTGNHPMQALAGLFVVFTTLVGTILGLRSADATSLDLVRAYGGGAFAQLRRVRLRAALPNTLAALKIAAPTAVLGAILGEFFGGNVEPGLGSAMVVSEQQLEVPRTWAIALVAAGLGGVGYLLVTLVERVTTPWARNTTAAGAP